jgi:hypothetical protein
MRFPLIVLAGLFLSATLLGCGASATIPVPPSEITTTPPGSSPEMTKVQNQKKGGMGGGMAPAKPANSTKN